MQLNHYRLLGKSGLRVSPLCLGTMTFGWGADKSTSRELLNRYMELGGNFVDTADAYSNGVSEEWLTELDLFYQDYIQSGIHGGTSVSPSPKS